MRALKWFVVQVLTWEAKAVLKRYTPRIIAVTGSVGKTTTKDAIYAGIEKEVFVRKSQKSFNSEIGVPLTILGLENGWRNPLRWFLNILYGLQLLIIRQRYPEWLLLEVGADRPGDIRNIARWLKPDIVVLTGVPELPVHVEFFDSPEALLREKRSLAEHVKAGGKLVLNGDDTRVVSACEEFRGMTVTYGFNNGNVFRAIEDEIAYEQEKPTGIRFRLERSASSFGRTQAGASLPVSIFGALGKPRIYAALAAFAVGEILGVDEVSIARGLTEWAPPPGRMRILSGKRGSVLIDDTYNSSPAAALSALDTLKEVQAKRRIAILGDMLELGKYSAEAHKNVGLRAAGVANTLITVGFRSRGIAEAALGARMSEKKIRQYEQNEAERAGRELEAGLKPGDVVLIKGSQSMRMERTVKVLLEEPTHAPEFLVRQDEEWLNR